MRAQPGEYFGPVFLDVSEVSSVGIAAPGVAHSYLNKSRALVTMAAMETPGSAASGVASLGIGFCAPCIDGSAC